MLDLSKTFNCLGHTLIHKINNLNKTLPIDGLKATWPDVLKSWKYGTEIKEWQKNITFKRLPIDRTVPQGSVLGHVLFILFTNDIPQHLSANCSTIMYTDDTYILLLGNFTDELAAYSNIALNTAHLYYYSNDMVDNLSKTKLLCFCKNAIRLQPC